MKKICFIGNYFKTAVFEAIANRLKEYGVESYWILPLKSQFDDFSKRYPNGNLLLLDRTYLNIESDPIGDFKLNEIIYGDRVWKYDKINGLKYLTNIQKPIYNFLKSNSIQIVFGEITWGHEILIYRLCSQRRELDCSYYTQTVTRMPPNRSFFFRDEKYCEILEVPNKKTEIIDLKAEKPSYLAINTKIVKKNRSFNGVLKRLYYFVSNVHIEPTNPNVIQSKWTRLKVGWREVLNQQTYRFLHRVTLSELEGKKFVLYGFHKQPEASVDVCGRYNDNQYEVVLNIWKQLPPGWLLVIKEHSAAIGDRSVCFYKKLLKYPNVVLINEFEDSHKIIEKAQLVVTNTGTLGLEAALKGVPAVSLSKVFFNILNYCKYYTWQEFEKYNSLVDIINEIKSKEDNREDLNRIIQKYSFEGTLGDIKTMPEIKNEENLSNLVEGFLALANYSE